MYYASLCNACWLVLTVWWMHLNCTLHCYLHSLSTIHKQAVVKWYYVVNASKLYIALLSTQLIHHSYTGSCQMVLCGECIWTVHCTVIYTANPPFINRQLSNGTVWWMHQNCTWYCYLHSLSTIHKQTVVKWYCVVNASKLYVVPLSTQLITIHKQTVVKRYCVVNASKLYMVLLSTQLIHHS